MALSAIVSQTQAQSIMSGGGKVELGFGFGPMFFLGDLGGSAGIGKGFVKDVDFPVTKLGKQLYLNYYPSEAVGLRVALNHGVVQGDDAQAPNKGGAEEDRLQRNLSFKSSIFEGYVAAEFYPTVFLEKYDGLQGKLRPYGVIGIGMYKFNPKAKDPATGEYVALQPLHLEGQGMAEYPDRKAYKLMQQEIPMGVGFKYFVKENMFVGFEVMHRVLFTDYVDDVSTGYIDNTLFAQYLPAPQAAQANRLYYRGTYNGTGTNQNIQSFQRGDPKQNDAFFSSILRFGWRLNDKSDPGYRARRQLRCPVYY